jgi:head-tail adaptor
MRAGLLRGRVAFDAPNGVADGFGGETIAWTEGDPISAQWLYAKGDETVEAARNAGRKSYKIKVRSSAATRAITEDYRMRDLRRGLPRGVTGDTLPGDRWNVIEVDAITDRRWVYVVVEGPMVA